MDRPDYGTAGVWDHLVRLLAHHRPRVSDNCGEVSCEPGWRWRTTLPDFDLWSVLRGRGRAEIVAAGDAVPQVVDLRPGTTLLLRPGDRISAEQDPQGRLRVCFVHHDFADGPPPSALLLPRVVELADRAAVQDRVRAVVRSVQRDGPSGRALAGLDLAAALLDCHRQLARSAGALPPPLDPRIAPVVDAVRAEPGRRLTLAQAARLARLSTDVFSRRFTAELGESFRTFCVRVRIDRARELLTTTTLGVAEIGRALGYRDHRLFVRQFADRCGQSPGAWRAGVVPVALPVDRADRPEREKETAW